jgi:monoamine oxidase
MGRNEVVRAGTQVGARAALAVVLALLAVGCTRVARPEPAPPATASPADCNKTTGYDVIIVGAGMSGLTAAKELQRGKADINVLILEATDRIGGRARTLKKGPPIDLGGAWLHGVATNQLTGIVDTLGFKRVTTRLEVPFFTEQGRLDDEQSRVFWETNELFEELMGQAARNQLARQTCRKHFSSSASMDLSKLGLQSWKQLELMQAFCEHLLAQRSDKASDYLPTANAPDIAALLAANAGPLESARDAAQTSTVDAAEFEADDDVLLEKGLGTFVEAYGQGVPVCLNSPVTRITYRDGGVVVEVAGGKRFEGRKALVTVSTGVLKANKIQFDPALPDEKIKAIHGLPMGYMQKVIIDLKDQEGLLPEKDADSWVLYVDANKAAMAFVIRPLNKNIAIGFYGGEEARSFEEKCREAAGDKPLPPERQPCDEQAVRRAQVALGKMYTPALEQAVEKADIYVTRWSLEPWTLGAYSAANPGTYVPEEGGTLSAREQLAKPLPYRKDPEDKAPHQVFFAGEACASPMYNGSLAGAYESGLRAARLMLNEFQRHP